MKKKRWMLILAILLLTLSALMYFSHYLVFRDAHHIFIYLIGDIAFVPVEVLLVTLILHKLLEVREKKAMLEKLNMVIGLFFSEVGVRLLTFYPDFDKEAEKLCESFTVKAHWNEKSIKKAKKSIKRFSFHVNSKKGPLRELKSFLITKRNFLMSILENPNILEHEGFTDLLWAVFHLCEELSYRKDISNLKQKDLEHVSGDIKRVYKYLFLEWLDYMMHLKKNYPYLFSLALRTNPFDKNATVEVK